VFRTNHHATSEPTTRATRHALDQRRNSQPDTSQPLTEGSTPAHTDTAVSTVEIPSTVAGRSLRSGRPRPYRWQRWRGWSHRRSQIGSRVRATCPW
jgi:hypothetical protein